MTFNMVMANTPQVPIQRSYTAKLSCYSTDH